MDESWRMTMGPTTTTKVGGPTHRRRQSLSNSETGFDPEDFDDVFGGPPRSVLARKLSADFTSSSEWFYQEVFQESDAWKPEIMEGQRLPEFRIPEQRRTKRKDVMKSKSTSSSVLSFEEEVSPFRSSPGMAVVGEEDVALSSFTSRLRPINVPYRWTSTSTSTVPTSKNNKQDLPAFGCNNTVYNNDNLSTQNAYTINNFIFGFPNPIPSPDTMNLEQLIADNYNNFRPYSPASTFGHDNETDKMIGGYALEDNISYQQRVNKDDHDEDDVMSSSYVIEVNSHTTEANNSEAIDIDEAIAWAKEQFQG